MQHCHLPWNGTAKERFPTWPALDQGLPSLESLCHKDAETEAERSQDSSEMIQPQQENEEDNLNPGLPSEAKILLRDIPVAQFPRAQRP